MNKVLKGLVAVAATAAMAVAGFAGASTAMADTTAKTNITITDAAVGDQFSAYRLLNLTTSVEGGKTNYSYTVNSKYEGVLKTAIDDLNGDEDAPSTDAAIIDYITKNVTAGDTADSGKVTARKFAETVRAKIVAANTPTETLPAEGTASKSDSADAEFSNMDQGYYLIIQTAATNSDGKTMSQVILNTHGQEQLDLTVKKDTVSLTKKVRENQDGVNNPAEDNWQDGADYHIGDMVPFQLTGTLPTDYANYSAYQYIFHDSASAGLTFNIDDADLKVYAVNGTDRTELKKATDANDKTGYTVVTSDLVGETFQVKFADLKQAAAKAGEVTIDKDTKIVVEYRAKLNENAKRGAAGNPNKAWLEFSNDQYNTGEGSPTGNTPPDEVIVFTFDIVVNKYKNSVDDANKLNNAGFTLYKSTNGTNWFKAQELDNAGNNTNVFRFNGLDSGYYKIVESKVPDGFTKADDVIFMVEATYDTTSDAPTLTGLVVKDANGSVISTGDNAKFTLSGITYEGTESANAQISTNIINKSGNELPSTGGMGTVLLYVAGVAVFVLAGATLVMALRRRNA
uniref:isopeptide-forming domain-containing fimbrial protein n=1 Tax=Bifidobacterium adolescentis TaxID=1680 RepID=UPI003FF0CA74